MTASCTAWEKGEKEPGPGVQEEGGEGGQEKQDGQGAIAEGGKAENCQTGPEIGCNFAKMLAEW